MKFDKKVRESGIVAAFTLVMTLTSVCSTSITTQPPSSQVAALTTESLKKKNVIEKATKKKIEKNVVATFIAEDNLEQKEEDIQQEISQKEISAKKEDSSEKKEKASKPETSKGDNSEKEEKISKVEASKEDSSEKENVSKAETSQEDSSKEENTSKPETSNEDSSKEENTSKPETSKEDNSAEEKASSAETSKEDNSAEEKASSAETSKEDNSAEEKASKTETSKEEKASKSETSKEDNSAEEKASSAETSKEDNSTEEKASKSETSNEEEKASNEEEVTEEKVVKDGLLETGSEEVSPWASKLLPDVEDYLNIRVEPSDEAELAGKLHKGALAEIVEKGDEWTKIRSGNVEGYVKNEFCVTGLEAENLANQVGSTYATATTGGVRVRENASSSEDTVIVDVLEEGGEIKVDTQAEEIEGWVAVKTEDATAYVSADYVDVELKLGKAVSIEEERAAIAAAEAEKARKEQEQREAQAQEQAQANSAQTEQRETVAASYDDVTLLGALIQCEAGGEPYEGKLAVGAVVINRLRAGYAGSISGVIYQGGQFTPVSSGALSSVLSSGVNGSCIQAAQEAINGVDNVGGATSFRRASSGASGIVIGNHVFF